MDHISETDWIARAKEVLPAGGYGNFDPSMILTHGKGSRVFDINGREYIDYLIGSGPMILGHSHPEVVEEVKKHLNDGLTFFANNTKGIELAEQMVDAMACGEHLRYVSTGGEADMYAMRLARAYTGREKILKFEGGYHGMSAEAQMSLAPEKLINFPQPEPDSAGIPQAVRDDVLVAPFNDPDFIRSLLAEKGDEIAAIIVEPLQRIIPPEPGYLELLRELTSQYGIVLIFDEIVTGFRFAYGGAQELYGVVPDLCTLGKIVGGGFPLAALTGPKEIMKHFDKAQANGAFLMHNGTLNGNPIASVAGMKTLEILRRPGTYDHLRKTGQRLMDMCADALDKTGLDYQIVGDQVLFDIVFTDKKVTNYRDTKLANSKHSAIFNKALREKGIFKSPSKIYPHLALSEEDLAQTKDALDYAAEQLMK